MAIQYVKHERIVLGNQSEFSENWLEETIRDDPSILGLGPLQVLGRQRTQPGGGRLDMLLADPSGTPRYEVELMRGAVDPDHIMRCIEYWDIERRRYPAYDHVAVLVAEDITGRFLNILSLFAGSIPLVVMQLSALKVGEGIVLNFVKVLDQRSLRMDDETPADSSPATDRGSWVEYTGDENMGVMDKILAFINEKASQQQKLNYKKNHIGMTDGRTVRNFVWFDPRTKFTYASFRVSNSESWGKRLEDAGFSVDVGQGYFRVSVDPSDFGKNEELFQEMAHKAVEEFQA